MVKISPSRTTKFIALLLLSLVVLSCKPEYSGDGALTYRRAPFFGFLWPSIYELSLPEIDISKPQMKTYNLMGIPAKGEYSIALVVPSSEELTPAIREKWGKCTFRVKKNKEEVRVISSDFSSMRNWIFGPANSHLNGLYTSEMIFLASDDQIHWELVFECTGFDSSEPVWAHIQLNNGGK